MDLGTYGVDVMRYPMLTRKQEYDWAVKARSGDVDARNKLVEGNLRFAIQCAMGYRGRGKAYKDLVAVANTGLIEAADRFDPDKGWKFITYAVWWINQALRRYTTSHMVHIPTNVLADYHKITQARERMEQELSDTPSDVDLKEHLGWDTRYDGAMTAVWAQETKKRLDLGKGLSMFDQPLSEQVADKSAPDPSEDANLALRGELAHELLASLSAREADVLKSYYMENQTLQVIGKRMGITRERVRQIKEQALERIRGKIRKEA